MSDTITLTGIVGTDPKHLVTTSGLAITSFRLASGQRRYDRATGAWIDGDTNWYTVSTFRHLAYNVSHSVRKGEHVLVTGKLRVRNWENPDRKGTSIEVEADSVGHDLFWCTTNYAKAPIARSTSRDEHGSGAPEPDAPEDTRTEDAGLQNEVEARTDGFLPDDAAGSEIHGLATIDS